VIKIWVPLLIVSSLLTGCVLDVGSSGVDVKVDVSCVIRAVQTPPEVKAWLKKSTMGPDGTVIVPHEVVVWLKALAVQQETLRRLGCVRGVK
jgi:hypothetical protein